MPITGLLTLTCAAVAGLSDGPTAVVVGLLAFGAVFALNSSLHSYLIVAFARDEGASMDVGFYYMSNAMGRLIGTVLSGSIYLIYGLSACLWIAAAMALAATVISIPIKTPNHSGATTP